MNLVSATSKQATGGDTPMEGTQPAGGAATEQAVKGKLEAKFGLAMWKAWHEGPYQLLLESEAARAGLDDAAVAMSEAMVETGIINKHVEAFGAAVGIEEQSKDILRSLAAYRQRKNLEPDINGLKFYPRADVSPGPEAPTQQQ